MRTYLRGIALCLLTDGEKGVNKGEKNCLRNM